ncbi:PLAT domain-containing protein 1-like [Triticum dicoccoides]|uniref:PLAT domain-containing protein 1-like n=1 Tax=Triticum dicoccoides TaxID=85692 RepID=UPI00188F1529|nr:PLAT domain-containing protein 1-like [Triticum dicoccoides]
MARAEPGECNLTHPHTNDQTPIRPSTIARLAALLLAFAVAVSTTALAHGRDLPTQIKLTNGGGVVGGDRQECVYTVYVRTGSIWKAGTDANITLELYTAGNADGVAISDLPSWGGLMWQGHSYFERGNLDIFSGRGPCMASAPCRMRVSSDGTGPHHGWYCNYVEVTVTVTGPHRGRAQQLFTVEQWLATDAAPYKLEAVVDRCPADDAASVYDRVRRRLDTCLIVFHQNDLPSCVMVR